MTETSTTMTPPTLEDMQRWTWVIGRAQQILLEFGIDRMQPVSYTHLSTTWCKRCAWTLRFISSESGP